MTNEKYKEIMKILIDEGAIGQMNDAIIQSKNQDLKDIAKICKAIRKKKHVQFACKPFSNTISSWACSSCRFKKCEDNPLGTGCNNYIPEWKELKPTDKFISDSFIYRILRK